MIPHHPVISRQKHRIISCTSILLTWTPSSGVNGYIISYDNGEGSSTTVTVTDGSTDRELLTGLQHITLHSSQFNSASVQFDHVEL